MYESHCLPLCMDLLACLRSPMSTDVTKSTMWTRTWPTILDLRCLVKVASDLSYHCGRREDLWPITWMEPSKSFLLKSWNSSEYSCVIQKYYRQKAFKKGFKCSDCQNSICYIGFFYVFVWEKGHCHFMRWVPSLAKTSLCKISCVVCDPCKELINLSTAGSDGTVTTKGSDKINIDVILHNRQTQT